MAYVFTTSLAGECFSVELVVVAKTASEACKKMANWKGEAVHNFFETYIVGGWDSHEDLKKMLKIKDIDEDDPEECIVAMLEYAKKVSEDKKKAREFLELFNTERTRSNSFMKWTYEEAVN